MYLVPVIYIYIHIYYTYVQLYTSTGINCAQYTCSIMHIGYISMQSIEWSWVEKTSPVVAFCLTTVTSMWQNGKNYGFHMEHWDFTKEPVKIKSKKNALIAETRRDQPKKKGRLAHQQDLGD